MPELHVSHPGTPVFPAVPAESTTATLKSVLGRREVAFQAVSHLSPTAGIILIGPVLAGFVAASTPLILLMAIVAILFTGLCVTALARKLPFSGGYYTYVSHGLGERSGFVTAWAYFLYDPLLPTLMLLISWGSLAPVIKQNSGLDIPWWAIVLILLATVFAATYRGVKVSAEMTLIIGVLESVIIIGLGLLVLIHSGGHSLSLKPLAFPHPSAGVQPLFLAFAFAVLLFTRFESGEPLAEETANPRKAIPRTVIWSTIGVGLIWVFVGYAMVIGWGASKIADIAAADNPFFILANRVSGWAWVALAFALLNSALGGALAGQNAGARVMYSLGRSGTLPRGLARVHRIHQTPYNALILTTVSNVVACLVLGTWLGPIGGFTFIGLFIALGVIVVYAMGNLAVIRLCWAKHRDGFNWFHHAVIPVVATAILAVGLYYSVWPLPAWPLNLAIYIVVGWLVLSVVISLMLGRTRRAELTAAAQLMFENGTGTEGVPSAPAGTADGTA